MPRLLLGLALLVAACGGDDQATADATGTTPATLPDGTTDASPTSGELTDAAASGDDGTCGDGVVSADEACDDGNQVDFDACSNTCVLPTCSDGQRNGEESDIDCGGTCGVCGDMATCNHNEDCSSGLCDRTCVGLYPTCLEMHMWHQSLPDGTYDIDPDGDGTPIQVFCDMVNGGWTEAAREGFEAVTGWSAGQTSSCGGWSTAMLGGAGQFGTGATTEKSFPLLGVPHKKVKVVAEAIIIDNWDAESLVLDIDGMQAASVVCSQGIPASCGPKEAQCGAPQWLEGKATLRGELVHATDTALVRFSSTLDMDAAEEAWGLDSVSVLVQ
jgi:cysteine-rich repeat protein